MFIAPPVNAMPNSKERHVLRWTDEPKYIPLLGAYEISCREEL
jgi:hypothetical protein